MDLSGFELSLGDFMWALPDDIGRFSQDNYTALENPEDIDQGSIKIFGDSLLQTPDVLLDLIDKGAKLPSPHSAPPQPMKINYYNPSSGPKCIAHSPILPSIPRNPYQSHHLRPRRPPAARNAGKHTLPPCRTLCSSAHCSFSSATSMPAWSRTYRSAPIPPMGKSPCAWASMPLAQNNCIRIRLTARWASISPWRVGSGVLWPERLSKPKFWGLRNNGGGAC